MYCANYCHVSEIHKLGPYNNLLDRKVKHYIGAPLLFISPEYKGELNLNVSTVSGSLSCHQKSRSPNSLETNKEPVKFDKYLGFVTDSFETSNLPSQTPLDMDDPQA